eukprot:Gb_24179 [translate_table: standard]
MVTIPEKRFYPCTQNVLMAKVATNLNSLKRLRVDPSFHSPFHCFHYPATHLQEGQIENQNLTKITG